ncbi:MAG: carboxypeptidase-like regulatory domain-containing protein [Candidatus Doudnabacteria bacterium]
MKKNNKYNALGILFAVLAVAAAVSLIYYWQVASQSMPYFFIHESLTANLQTYKNDQYGFSIALPNSWKGFMVQSSQWEGRSVASGKILDHGPLITLRHPLWTAADPREDMPVMVFTPSQWTLVQQEKMSLGAAPIAPGILAQNSQYIIALPARYNYDFKTGWEEVDQLVHKLKAYNPPTSVVQIGNGTLTGHVTIGPNCPVERVGMPCPPSPQAYAGTQIIVYKNDAKTVAASAALDSSGDYSLNLPAGSYLVTYKSSVGMFRTSPAPRPVTIKAGQSVKLDFSIDTGIR